MARPQRSKVVGRAQLQRRMEKAKGATTGLLEQSLPMKEGGRVGRAGQARFRAAAFSVLSPANRQFMEAQEAAAAEGPREERKIILGGETFKVGLFLNLRVTQQIVTLDTLVGPNVYYLLTYSPSLSQVTEDLKVITEEDEAAVPEDGGSTKAPESPSPPRAPLPLPPLSLRPPLRRTPSLSKRESLMSINRYNACVLHCMSLPTCNRYYFEKPGLPSPAHVMCKLVL